MEKAEIGTTNRQSTIEAFADLTAHPDTGIIPRMTEGERADLTKDIKAGGQRETIKVFQGQIVDGRERYEICKALGLTPRVEAVELPVGTSVMELVLSFNYHRRHLTDSQRAVIAARMVTTSLGANQSAPTGQVTQNQAANACQTSVDSLQRAKAILAFGNESLTQAVMDGRLDVFNATKIVKDSAHKSIDLNGKTGNQLLDMAKETVQRLQAAKKDAVMAKVEELRQNNKPLPTGKKYGLIYADPAWDYLPEHKVGYPTMTVEQICAMEVAGLAEDNAVLAMWVPASQLAQGLQVVAAWGFEFKTCAVWDKELPGTGQYFLNQHELLFIATRGNASSVPLSGRRASVLREKRGKHSKKPMSAYALLEGMYEELTKVELFARGQMRDGWDGWGNECLTNQPEQVEAPKALPKAKSPKAPAKGKAANDAKAKPAKATGNAQGAKHVPLKKAA